MTLLTIPIILMVSLLFTRLNHPLSLGFTLLMQTIMISMTAGISTYSYWFSYVVFMIFLVGLLVLFIYVASLASNEPFSFSVASFPFYSLLSGVTTLLCFLLEPMAVPHLSSLPTSSIHTQLSTPILVTWIYSNTSMIFTLFIILYLLLTLIVAVKITNLYKGPVRLSN